MRQIPAAAVALIVSTAVGHAQAPAARAPVPGAPAGVTAFVGVNVVPMDTERVLPNHTVVVEGGRITALGPSGKVPVPAGAVRIDGQGKYLLPGLADMHAHDKFESSMRRGLAAGVTTVRIAGSLEQDLQARAAAGEIWSPWLYIGGQWAPPHYSYRQLRPKDPALRMDSIALYVAAYKTAGYDHLKIRKVQPVVFDSLVAATRRVGMPLIGHVPPEVDLEHALASGGMRSIEHLTGYIPWAYSKDEGDGLFAAPPDTSPARLRRLAEATKHAGVWNVPTLTLTARFKPPAALAVMKPYIKALQEAGAGLLLGTDYNLASVHQELKLFVAMGLTPYEALLTGTRNIAEFYGTLDEVGTITVGKRADLVLVNGNPLEDIRYTKEVTGTMIGGRWLATSSAP